MELKTYTQEEINEGFDIVGMYDEEMYEDGTVVIYGIEDEEGNILVACEVENGDELTTLEAANPGNGAGSVLMALLKSEVFPGSCTAVNVCKACEPFLARHGFSKVGREKWEWEAEDEDEE